MIPQHLAETLTAALVTLPDAPAWQPEHVARLAARLTALRRGVVDRPAPTFAEETTPPLEPLFAPWRPLLDELDRSAVMSPELVAAVGARLAATTLDGLLILLGMRRTPGSVSGPDAIPPTTGELLRAAALPFHEGEALSTAGRAWTKHVPRSGEAFWGRVQGGASDHNRTALGLLQRILAEATWWNVYGHFQRGIVFEARIPSGHGARWQVAGPVFVGFLEPFQAGGIEARAGG